MDFVLFVLIAQLPFSFGDKVNKLFRNEQSHNHWTDSAFSEQLYSEKQSQKENRFSDKYIQQLQTVFRFTNLKNTPLASILYNEAQNDIIKDIADIAQYDIADKIEHYSMRYLEQLRQHSSESEIDFQNTEINGNGQEYLTKYAANNANKQTANKYTDTHQEQTGEQEGGYEGCRRDYGALAEPITNGIIERVGRRIANRIYADTDDWNEFCSLTCSAVCNLIEIPGCNTGCEQFCKRYDVPDNATKDHVIDAMLDVVIPDIEAQPWARKSRYSNVPFCS